MKNTKQKHALIAKGVKLDPYTLKGIFNATRELEDLTDQSSSLIVDEEAITIVQSFNIPMKERSVERQKKFEKLVREVSLRYLFSGKASRIIIERDKDHGRLLIEFRPPTNIFKQ